MKIYKNIEGHTVTITDEAYNLFMERRKPLDFDEARVQIYALAVLNDHQEELSDEEFSNLICDCIVADAMRHIVVPGNLFATNKR